MIEISQNIHKKYGIDHNFNMVLSILNIKNIYNTNFSPGYSLVWSNIQKDQFLQEKHKRKHFCNEKHELLQQKKTSFIEHKLSFKITCF